MPVSPDAKAFGLKWRHLKVAERDFIVKRAICKLFFSLHQQARFSRMASASGDRAPYVTIPNVEYLPCPKPSLNSLLHFLRPHT